MIKENNSETKAFHVKISDKNEALRLFSSLSVVELVTFVWLPPLKLFLVTEMEFNFNNIYKSLQVSFHYVYSIKLKLLHKLVESDLLTSTFLLFIFFALNPITLMRNIN